MIEEEELEDNSDDDEDTYEGTVEEFGAGVLLTEVVGNIDAQDTLKELSYQMVLYTLTYSVYTELYQKSYTSLVPTSDYSLLISRYS